MRLVLGLHSVPRRMRALDVLCARDRATHVSHLSPCPDAPGPKVVSQELSAMLLEEVEGVLGRRPVIWDNLFANDYDCRRVFLGPYTGRAPGLMPRLCGLLLNPNCELQANFIPIHTLGSWFRSELGSCASPDHAGTRSLCPRPLCIWGPTSVMRFHARAALAWMGPAHLCLALPWPHRLPCLPAWLRWHPLSWAWGPSWVVGSPPSESHGIAW